MKILLISHNCFSTYQNMGKTFLSLFSRFERSEICQLYIYPTIPDVDVCSSYFRITDKDMLNSFLKFKKPGSEIDKSKIAGAEKRLFESKEDAKLYARQGKKDPIKRILRDVMWKLSRWYTKDLEAWIKREAPAAIFLSPGYAKFIYDIALKISKKFDLPIITYICDDYYFVNSPKDFLGKLQLKLLKKKTETLMKKTSHLVTICTEIKKFYEEKFKLDATVLMTGTTMGLADGETVSEAPRAMCYFGNISCNRYISLAEMGRTLDRLNEKNGTEYELKIYTGEKRASVLSAFDGIKSICLCGFISGREFEDTLRASDMLLHTEAFDEASIDLVKHSVSTKIADSLASGIPLFAYGPETVASMKHLIDHNAAITCTSPDELEKTLSEAFNDADLRRRVAASGLNTAREYHDAAKNSEKLKELFNSL